MSAPRKYHQEFRDRAVEMYRDRLATPGESKLGARRHVGVCESTIGLFKTEAIHGPSWSDRRQVEWQVARWVHWYNTERLHSLIGHLPPIEFEQQHRQAKTTTPTTTSSPEVA